MGTTRRHIRIDRSADNVWNVVSDHGAIADWFPAVESSSATGSGRACPLADGTELEEEIATNDTDLRRLQYRITKGMPVDFHLATVDVLEDGDGALVIYSSGVEPHEVADAIGPPSSPASTASRPASSSRPIGRLKLFGGSRRGLRRSRRRTAPGR